MCSALFRVRPPYLVGMLILGSLWLSWSPLAHAHAPPVDQTGHHIQLVLYADRILVDYAIVFSEIAYYRILADMNIDGESAISEEERAAYHAKKRAEILGALELTVDGRGVPLMGDRVDDSNPRIFSYLFSAPVAPTPTNEHEIRVYNNAPVARGEYMEYWLKADYGIRFESGDRWQKPEHAGDEIKGKRGVLVRYRVGERPADAGSIDPSQTGTPIEGGTQAGERLKRFIESREFSPKLLIIGLLTAAFLGALHALTPGHGKAVVAAYLVGSKGRVWDAVLLGCVVTITHTFSVILLGLIALYASQYILPQELFPWLGVISGMLIVLIGTWLLIRRIQAVTLRTHAHTFDMLPDSSGSHAHVHPPHAPVHPYDEGEHGNSPHVHGDQAHGHLPPERAGLGSILSLGIAGGIIPCPDAMIVLLIAVAVRRIALGLIVIAAFSVGLAAVLVTIGVLIVLAKPVIDRFTGTGRWAYRLPIASAIVVILLGVAIAIQSLMGAGLLIVNF